MRFLLVFLLLSSMVIVLAACPKEESERGSVVPKLDGCSYTGQDRTNHYFDCWKKR